MLKKRGISFALAVALVTSSFFTFGAIDASAAVEDKEILDYDMSDVNGTTVKDSTGNFNGTFVNPENAELITNDDTNTSVVSFKGGQTDSFIEIPKGVLDGMESMTVSSLVNWAGSGGAQWVYGFGQGDTHYVYYTPAYIGGSADRVGIATNGWRNETYAASPRLASGEWKLVTNVINGPEETLETYVDGELVATGSTNGITLADIKKTDGLSGYIGKSFYAADPYFNGMVADFEVYNDALTAEEVGTLYEKAVAKVEDIGNLNGYYVEKAAEELTLLHFLRYNDDAEQITTDLDFPDSGAYDTTITWESSNPDVISNDGKVNRPAYLEGDIAVTLTATISDGTDSVTKEFTLTVMRKMQDADAIEADTDALIVYNQGDVRGNLNLPTEGENGSTISWASSDTSLITTTGEVSRPAHGEGDVTVHLTATLTLNQETAVKEFTTRVKEMPENAEDNAAYMMTYFNGEAYEDGEQIRFAFSDGNDVTQWNEINNGEPVITSHLGEKGLRDPSIIRSPEGDKFYLLATDLKVYGTGGNWARTVREGSNSLMIWESTDLVNWSKQRMVEITTPETGNTWAPEVFYDDSTGEYIVYWSSFVYDSVADRYGDGKSHNRIMYAKTRDFHTFTEPKTLLDLGHDILDTVAIEHNDKIYRITKGTYYSEKEWAGEEIREHVFQEVGDSFFGDFELVKEGIGMDVLDHGEGAEIFKSNTEEDKFYLLIDEYGGGRGYTLFETTDIDSADWKLSEDINLPDRPRHGDVMSITQEEYERLQNNIPHAEEGDIPTQPEPNDIVGNPIIKDRFSADPAAIEHDGKVYLYAGHDQASVTGNFFNMKEWDIYSSSDMKSWELEGSVPRTTFEWGNGNTAWASEPIEKNGKFYWYVTVENSDLNAPGMAIGVAESDDPVTGWKDAIGGPLVKSTDTKNPDNMGNGYAWDDIDPTVFIDDEGQAYLYWGNTKLYYAKLKDNMIEFDGEIHEVEIEGMPGTFTEGPHIHEKEGTYYLTYAMNYPEELAYATSDSPEGPWVYGGKLMDTVYNSPTSHPAVIEFEGKSYLIYHNAALPTGGEYRRSVAIEELIYNPDGSIQKVVPTASGIHYSPYLLQGYDNQDSYVRHVDGDIQVEDMENATYDYQWHQVAGLANDKEEYVSFQSEDNPGFYLIRDGSDIKLAKHDGSEKFKEQATFKVTPGLAEEDWTSFQAYKDGRFLYQKDDQTLGVRMIDSEEEERRATFKLKEFEETDETAPTAPTNVEATAVSESGVELSWEASEDNVGVTGYTVYRDGEKVGTTTSTTFQDTGLTDATTYEYTVTAVDAAGNISEASEPVSVATTTSVAHLDDLLAQYVENGDVNGPLVKKLENSMKQVIHHQENGHDIQTVKHLENFLKHLDKAKAAHVTEDAKEALSKRADLLIEKVLNQ
ncbi:immunoglobulin-like domain-containing protein [Pseudalkalibacillus salsuginis]|uniref:immunoglobulin-like domain-containing protein n=1 Tax=Pseudalkalibacillus salsuginis TaxID=2910972 RepID=UPI001F4198F7|nr:immunoglobulin-like domain-containing protein [Pseudalkalibacillus salsuginis]MCF6411538.1 family 43 glycosylhydrolase [Pseudalkalibacillus salsuginis]